MTTTYDPWAGIMTYLPIMIGVLVLGAAISLFTMMRNKKKAQSYLEKYPDAVKVWPQVKFMVVASSQIMVELVDGEKPAYFNGGVYVKPGKSILTVTYDFSRMGVIYKSVNKSTGSVKVEVNLEAGKEYLLTFDKEEGFQIAEK